jgi:hypothetical protein
MYENCLGGISWWLYIYSQLGFTKSFCLLLQVDVLGLAGFVYSSSGLLPGPKIGRPKMRTRGVVPLSVTVPPVQQACFSSSRIRAVDTELFLEIDPTPKF